MSKDTTELKFDARGRAREESIVICDHVRFTVLTERLLRIEYDPAGKFEDRPTQTVLCRDFPTPEFHVVRRGEGVEISTPSFHLVYDGGGLAAEHLYIDAKNNYTNYGARWRFGERTYGDPPRHNNLLGTARTLDKLDGGCELGFGLIGRSGHSFFDDTASLALDGRGRPAERAPGTLDYYYLCCQHDYFGTLRDFYRLSGAPPMIPRYTLGNWWSRYHRYSDEGYSALMDKFERQDIPFSVAVLDMDWHLTKIPEKYGRGWTGFTWNRSLFPDPEDFLRRLHDRGMHTVLNLHPADGVQGYEDAYREMAEDTGVDPDSDEPVNFDFTDETFINAYFRRLIRPEEERGVDFWWIDWQQGKTCRMPGLDPMWALNHYHYLDNGRDGKRGMILSRYTGLGSQRYPAGFSGDTISTWKSLEFQPYFTATAVNAGYPWWSHDIGGFKTGVRDSELFLRWLQFGVFSVFMRLHSSNSPFTSKDPDSFEPSVRPVIADWLRLRYRLIPYIYTAVSGAARELCPPIYPVYYRYPEASAAYSVPNEYFLGSELLVCPITSPADPDTGYGSVCAWIPDGIWTDIFTGHPYRGGRRLILNRPREQMPVLAKPGGIVPLAAGGRGNSTANPDELEIMVFPGASNSYELYEDAGEGDGYRRGEYAVTHCRLEWGDTPVFTAEVTGDLSVLPTERGITVSFRGFESFTPVSELPFTSSFDPATRTLTVCFGRLPAGTPIRIELSGARADAHADIPARVFEFLNYARLPVELKTQLYGLYRHDYSDGELAASIAAADPPKAVRDILFELSF